MCEAILALSGTTNGRVAVAGFEALQRRTGHALADLAADQEGRRIRFADTPFVTNSEIPPSKIDAWCAPSPEGKKLLEKAVTDKHLSARGLSRVRKVARTIADLDGSDTIEARHLAEALQYRPG